MKPMKKLYLLSFLLPFTAINFCYSQETNYATNTKTTLSDEKKLYINFDIISNDGSKYFYVVLELMYQGTPVKPNPNNLYGAQGHAITPGNKVVYWDYENDFNQDINKLEVNVFAWREKEPQAKFRSTTESGNFFAPCKINFSNLSENSDRYEWDFGDATSGVENNSFEENPSHTYKKGGRYTISLTAYNTNLNLQNSFYETIVVKEHESTVADFKIIGFENLKKQSVPITIEFKNLSLNADGFMWDFGDPQSGRNKNTSTDTHPSHRYKNPGQYKIELTATNSFSGLSSVKTMEIVLPGKPQRETTEPTQKISSDYDKHKKMKTIWLTSTITTATVGTALLLKSNGLHNDYKTATSDAKEIREKFEKLDKIYPVAFGAAVLSGVMTGIQAKKQKEAQANLSFYVVPYQDGGLVTLSCNF
jgi:PKD repeat protein